MGVQRRGSLGDPRRLLGALLQRPQQRYNRPGRQDDGFSLRPNAPRMVTVVAAVALTLLGVSQTLVSVPLVDEWLLQLPFEITREHAYIALIASPSLLVAGSFLRGL